jgi:hypothetical protein
VNSCADKQWSSFLFPGLVSAVAFSRALREEQRRLVELNRSLRAALQRTRLRVRAAARLSEETHGLTRLLRTTQTRPAA